MRAVLVILSLINSIALIILSKENKELREVGAIQKQHIDMLTKEYRKMRDRYLEIKDSKHEDDKKEMKLEIVRSGKGFNEMLRCPECGSIGELKTEVVTGEGPVAYEFGCECYCRWAYNKVD